MFHITIESIVKESNFKINRVSRNFRYEFCVKNETKESFNKKLLLNFIAFHLNSHDFIFMRILEMFGTPKLVYNFMLLLLENNKNSSGILAKKRRLNKSLHVS